jgi:hypothetical protein
LANINKATKVEKYIANNNYFSKSNNNGKESIEITHKNDVAGKVQKSCKLDLIRNACHVGKRSNNNVVKDNRSHAYKLNGSANSLVNVTEPTGNTTNLNSNQMGSVILSPFQNPRKS